MAEPFLAEVRIFSFPFAPRGWAVCNGQALPINQHQALYTLLGTTYGGDGTNTFALPNLQGRVPVHTGNGIDLGQADGEMTHTLTQAEMPAHIHNAVGTGTTATSKTPVNLTWAPVATGQAYYSGLPNTTMNPAALTTAGGSQAHQNMQPYLVLNFCIALEGIFPSRN